MNTVIFSIWCVYIIAILYLSGFFRWIDHRLNEQVKPGAEITPGELAVIRADIEKLKLALNFKEFKR